MIRSEDQQQKAKRRNETETCCARPRPEREIVDAPWWSLPDHVQC